MDSGASALSECEFGVLNALHLKKVADSAQLAALTGLEETALEAVLESAAARQLVLGTAGGHMLLPDGTRAVQQYYARHYRALRDEPRIAAWYERFEVLNRRFIGVLSAWQEGGGDDRLFKALELVERLREALDELVADIPRYAGYQRRFDAAIAAIDAGDTDLLCNPRRDSAHNIWFEIHEDILGVLGRPRDTS